MAQLTLPQATFPVVQQTVVGAENRPFAINDLPPAVRAAFPGLKTFNKLQVTVAGTVLQSDDSLVVNAPTGSGKTVILELAIVKLSVECTGTRQFRVVYLAPTRSLCAEKYHDWRVRFAGLGISCIQYDGDNAVEDIGKLGQHQLILSTPEKWEVFTRHWGDQMVANVLRPIRLFLIDEIQVMDDGVRGANLELVVSRMKYIDSRMHREQLDANGQPESIRFLAVSACIPNVDDIAHWLKNGRNVVPFSFAEAYRTTRIGKHVTGFPCTTNPYKFELDLNYKLPAIIDEYSRQKPTLVFCSSRKSAETTANVLARSSMRRILPSGPILAQMSAQIASKGLQDCVAKGVAYHHAGLLHTDRSAIESHFRSGHLAVLCCTSTLCMGVNLPAYLVIIKSTYSYAGKSYTDNYILQMMGRAGRAQYNEDGVAVILTADVNVDHYRQLVAGTVPVESQLHHRLAELLNSEIAHGIIYDQPAVMEWVRSTFFHVRARTNPSHYNLPASRDIEEQIEQLCRGTIDSLEESGMILRRRPNALLPTVCGKLMARNHLSFKTMQLLQSDMKGTETLQEMLLLITRAHEFCEYKCRNNEKRILNALNAPSSSRDTPAGLEGGPEESPAGIRFRWPGRISSIGAKIYCLVQAVFGNLTISDHGLHQEAAKIVTLGTRIGRCAVGLLDANGDKFPAGCFSAMLNVTRLIQCFQVKLWYDSPYLTKQLYQIGPKLARHLADRGKVTFQALRESDPREVECILKKQPPFGNDIISFVDRLPQFTIELSRTTGQNPGGIEESTFLCTVSQQNAQHDPADMPISFSVLVGDSANRLLLHRTVESVSQTERGEGLSWPIYPTNNDSVTSLSAHLICQDWVGLDRSYTLHLVNPPVGIKHKQTTITNFFPNQTISNDTVLQVEQFPIPFAQEMPHGDKLDRLFGPVAYPDPLGAFRAAAHNLPGAGVSFLERSAAVHETTLDEQTAFGNKRFEIPTVLSSINANNITTVNLSSSNMSSTSMDKHPLMALLGHPLENMHPTLRAIDNRLPAVDELSFVKKRFELSAALNSTTNTTAISIGTGNTSCLVLPRSAAAHTRLPIRSILKRPAATGGDELFKNPQTCTAAQPADTVRRRSRTHFSSEEFRYMFRQQKWTQSFTFCSPSEDIIDCFQRHNIFITVDGMKRDWFSLFGEDGTKSSSSASGLLPAGINLVKETLPPDPKKKNFDLGPAENVICLDE